MGKKIDLDRLKEFKTAENGTVAKVESTSTASQAYAIGDYFWYTGKLYIATATIASGSTITPNTNCKLAVLGDDVSDLKSALRSGAEEDAEWHLGFYLDENGDLCQVD